MLDVIMRPSGTRPSESAIFRGLASVLDAQLTQRGIEDFAPELQSLYRERTAQGERSNNLTSGHLSMLEGPEATAVRSTGSLRHFPDSTGCMRKART